MNWSKRILPRDFYTHDPTSVAQNLLGAYLVRVIGREILVGKIVETEAYLGFNDPASHAHKGQTKRNKSLFKGAGFAYVHSMRQYHLVDATTYHSQLPGSVLIRAIEPIQGLEMRTDIANGPGKVGRAFQITKALDGVDITDTKSPLFIANSEDASNPIEVFCTTRVGISKGRDKLLRFYICNNPYVSKK